MNRTGLFTGLAAGLIGGLVFAIFPELDLWLARLFYDTAARHFAFSPVGGAQLVRRAAMWIAWAFAAPAVVALVIKLVYPSKPLLVSGRAIIFLLTTLLLTGIILPDVVFKGFSDRPRPIATTEFNGERAFKPWWHAGGTQLHTGSFFSGEAATAFWTYAPAALAPPSVRPLAFAAATLFGLTTGLLRMAFGGHYASDVLAAGVTAFLVTWLVHGFIYRWNTARLTDAQIDEALSQAITDVRRNRTLWWLIAAIGALTLFRLGALGYSVVDLFPDEARYWAWAQTPAFGYFSKPPLIAWIIGAAEWICGNSEVCVRAPASVIYAATGLVTYMVARRLYDERTGCWTALCIALSTGVVFSARIISTDVPLLFFWAIALLAYLKMLDASRPGWALALGLALGFGLLGKYAMIYFLLGAITATFVDQRAQRLWRQPAMWFALVIASLIVLPNLVWNATHSFVTFRHTRENIVGAGFHLNPLSALGFLGSQFGVCGPVTFAVFLLVLVRSSTFRLQASDRLMIAFALPPLMLVTLLGLFTSVNANWAAPSAISITILAVAILVRQRQWRWLQVSIAVGLVLQITLAVTDALADRVSLSFLPKPDIYHRTMGWKAMSTTVARLAQTNHVRTIAADQSDVIASLLYYLRDGPWPILAWPVSSVPMNQFDLDRPVTPGTAEPILYLSNRPVPNQLAARYSRVEALPPIQAATGPTSTRRFSAFKLAGARSPLGRPPSADP